MSDNKKSPADVAGLLENEWKFGLLRLLSAEDEADDGDTGDEFLRAVERRLGAFEVADN